MESWPKPCEIWALIWLLFMNQSEERASLLLLRYVYFLHLLFVYFPNLSWFQTVTFLLVQNLAIFGALRTQGHFYPGEHIDKIQFLHTLLHNPSISFQAWDFYGIHRGFENWVPLNPFNPSVWLRQTWSEGDRERERNLFIIHCIIISIAFNKYLKRYNWGYFRRQ